MSKSNPMVIAVRIAWHPSPVAEPDGSRLNATAAGRKQVHDA
jgi:hypothetical protein